MTRTTLPALARFLALALGAACGVACGGGGGTSPPTDPPGAERATEDRPDDVTGPQLHVLYVLPADAPDRRLDVSGALANSVASFQRWLAERTGGRRLRVDTYRGALDVTFRRLARTDAELRRYGAFVRDTLERGLARAGFARPGRLYVVYYDGGSTFACGGGAWPPALPGVVAAMYLRGTPPGAPACDTNVLAPSPDAPAGYLELAMLHEVLHTLGLVGDGAPREHARGHVPEPNDLMYAGGEPWRPAVLDVGGDDYFGANVPAGVPNLAASPYLLPAPAPGGAGAAQRSHQ
jgi:hypothetical protein